MAHACIDNDEEAWVEQRREHSVFMMQIEQGKGVFFLVYKLDKRS
jgi:hypothetical protein